MASFRAPRAANSIAMLLVLAAASGAAAQIEVPAYTQQQRQILERIEALQAVGGPYSPELLQELRGLIALYRENGDESLAVVAIERALQVVRANSGLYSLEQVPLIWQRIEAEEARGNETEVWDLEQELLTLVRRHPEDLNAAPILRRMAGRQMAVLDRVLAGERPPQVVLGCFYKIWPNDEGGSCEAGSVKDVVQGMVAEAQRNYADAIAILLRNEDYSSGELVELEMEMLRGAELIRSTYEDDRRSSTGSRVQGPEWVPVPLAPPHPLAKIREPWRSRTATVRELAEWELPYESAGEEEADFLHEFQPRDARFAAPYHRGRQSLRRLYEYGAASSSSALQQATALAQMADWDLLFSHHGFALEGYELARGMLGDAEASAAQLFAPPMPVVLPAFQPNPLTPDDTRPAKGHIDVAFAITKYGRARDIDVREAENSTDAEQRDLVSLLKSSRFRPRVTDGAFTNSAPVSVRYYLYE